MQLLDEFHSLAKWFTARTSAGEYADNSDRSYDSEEWIHDNWEVLYGQDHANGDEDPEIYVRVFDDKLNTLFVLSHNDRIDHSKSHAGRYTIRQ